MPGLSDKNDNDYIFLLTRMGAYDLICPQYLFGPLLLGWEGWNWSLSWIEHFHRRWATAPGQQRKHHPQVREAVMGLADPPYLKNLYQIRLITCSVASGQFTGTPHQFTRAEATPELGASPPQRLVGS